MKKRSLFFVLAYFFIIQGCQKELSFDNSNTPVPLPTIDSNYLYILYGIEINGTVADTGEIYSYSYDQLKRVVAVSGAVKNFYDYTQASYNYYYNNNDTLPFKSRAVRISANDPAQTMLRYDTTITWHFFDNSGKNIKDSMIHSSADASSPVPYYSTLELRSYSYSTGKIFGYRSYTGINVPNPGYVFPDQKDTATLDALGNITDNKTYRFNSMTSQFELEVTSAFTYDAKQSPFSRISNFKTFGVFPNGETFLIELPQYSNRVSQNEHHSFSGGGSGVHYDYSYNNTYNSNGLIKQILIYDQPVNPSGYGKIILTYTHL
jgi:hypothetical protein